MGSIGGISLKARTILALGVCAAALRNPVEAAIATATQGLSATFAAVAKLSVPATVTFTNASRFAPYTGVLPVTYRARTSAAGGGAVTLQVTGDFTPAGGPLATSGALTYTCSGASLGTACTGSQTASTTVQTPVLTLPASACTGGGGTCSSLDPNSVTVTFTVPDNPGYATGSYSAKVTLIISAT